MTDPNELPPGAQEVPTSGTFKKWEKVGDAVTGVALRLVMSRKYKGENFVLELRDDAGAKIAVSAPLKLKQAVEDHDLIGERLFIRYSGDTETKGGKVKEFRVARLPKLTTQEHEDDLPF